MISLNADLLTGSLAYARKKGFEAKIAARDQYRSHVLAMFRELLLVTPQYSSDLVSNWDIEVEGADYGRAYQEWPEKAEFQRQHAGGPSLVDKVEPHHAGDQDEAFQSAYARGINRMRYISYFGQPVYFVNPTLLEIDSPLVIGPDGVRHHLRDTTAEFAWLSISSYLQEHFGSPA